jgi:phosphomannomutase
VYLDGGIQIISPTDREIETAMAAAPFADEIARAHVEPADPGLIEQYIERAVRLRRSSGPVRVALTPLHGVGGDAAVETLRRAGFDNVHTVASQFRPDPDFPTVRFPNPEEPGATDALLALAEDVDAEIAIALDPDADRCAVGIPTPTGWRMLSGDETGWLLGDFILSRTEPSELATSVVASTVVSSRMLSAIAAHWGARHVETLTGFKWLARADADVPGSNLIYAYEEAIGHCVDPAAVRDKDGISAAVLACDLVAACKLSGRSVLDALDDLARRFGVHVGAGVSRAVADPDEATALMRRLRTSPPSRLGRFASTTTDLLQRPGVDRTDALIFTGGDAGTSARVVVRPSGTEPKVKCYIEVRSAVVEDLATVRRRTTALCDDLASSVQQW